MGISSERLTLRLLTLDDVDTFVEYRSDPTTLATLGSGVAPTVDGTRQRVEAALDRGGPAPGEWTRWAIVRDGELIGDVSCEIRLGGGIAEIGYVLRPEHRGHGYAAEAAGALVDHLIAHHGVHRVEASLDPENRGSMRVLEAIGMRFEVIARLGFCRDGVWEDDLRYSMTADERAAWRDRPRHHPERVELVTIEPDEAYLWGRLATHYSQQWFVATMPLTWRDALLPEQFEGITAVPVFHGVLADGERAAFVMLSTTHGTSEGRYLWRLLVDRMHQRRGIASAALGQVCDDLRAEGVPRLFTSYSEGPGGPRRFYDKLGFTHTGRIIDEEHELVLEL